MEERLPYSRPLYWMLLAFAAVCVASIALQSLVWPAVALFLFVHWKTRRPIDWPWGAFPAAALFFTFTFFLAAVIGIDPAVSFKTVHKYLTILLIFPVAAMGLTVLETRKILLAFLYGADVCAVAGLYKHFAWHYDRIDSFSGDKMVFAGMLMSGLLLELFFLKNAPKSLWHWFSFFLIGYALILTETRGAWVGLVAGFVLLAWRFNRKWLLIGAVALVGCFFLLPRDIQERAESIVHLKLIHDAQGRLIYSEPSRFMIWAAGWHIIQDHPWGVGQGNLEIIYPRYKLQAMNEPTEPHLHNNFLQLLAQNGWQGLLAYVMWIITYFWAALRFKTGGEPGDMNWTFASIFLAVLVWGQTEYTFSHQYMNFQFFLLGLQVGLWKDSGAS